MVEEYLQKENRVAGPFTPEACVGHVTRFGVIPKSHQPHKWRLNFDQSSPKAHSVNDGVQKELCSMSYVSVDDAVGKILDSGPGPMLAKIDIKSVFRLIPVHPADKHLLAMSWKGALYINTCLPFGLRSAPGYRCRPLRMDPKGMYSKAARVPELHF